MKSFSILGGKAHVVELPEGATNHHIHKKKVGSRLRYALSNGINTSIELPQGNWKIVGMLPEVTEEQAGMLVAKVMNGQHHQNYNYKSVIERWVKTAIESLESAIRAEGYTFQSTPKPKNKDFYWGYLDDLAKWEAAQSRVLCRERCLLLGREGV